MRPATGRAGLDKRNHPGTCTDPDSAPNRRTVLPNKVFQFHHQPFDYYANYIPGAPVARTCATSRIHLARVRVEASVRAPSVSFIKPIGQENEHPGYASEPNGRTISSICFS
jgi:phospholipase C